MKRYKDAWFIIQGAVNPIAVTRTLNEAVQEAWAETGDMTIVKKDPAVRLIAYQLAHILELREYDNGVVTVFASDYDQVKEKANG